MLGVRNTVLTINHMLVHWWQIAKSKSLFAWLLKMFSCLIIWKIWKATNKAKFEDIVMNHLNIIEATRLQVVSIYQAHKLVLPKGKTPLHYESFSYQVGIMEKPFFPLGEIKC